MGTILLTSQGFYNQKIIDTFNAYSKDLKDFPALIITTACDDKNNNKWAIKAKESLIHFGYKKVDLHDIEEDTKQDYSQYKTIYVAGGNGFRLTKSCKENNFSKIIVDCLNSGGAYVGVSAGSVLLAPSILLEAVFEPEKIPDDFNDFSGLGIIPFTIMPHYNPQFENDLVEFERTHGYKIHRLTNEEFILLSDFEFKTLIG